MPDIVLTLLLSINIVLTAAGVAGFVWMMTTSRKATVLALCLALVPSMWLNIHLNHNPSVIYTQKVQK